ncbi:hypothetical protein DYU05_12205 [Mucilaginibacter terrenus]|uniref:Teneurin NHL domain-containing protein n=1 Tax=Mucilaginibacter terrenus TaxID=2482727 RepID=A0A3E2NPI0_9SPHI|nr:hypothetical protein DYU05_12205 [Mucilaginibacter terrenus]
MLLVVIAAQQTYAQLPRFRDQPAQQYFTGTPITPVAPTYRPTSGTVPPNIYGEVTTVAGSGSPGLVNAKGRNAAFTAPSDVKMDAAGNLYVSDAGNNCIRMIAPDGTVSTYAGSGVAGYADGNGASARFNNPACIMFDKQGNLFVTDKDNNAIRQITPTRDVSVFAGIPGTAAMTNNTFMQPTGLTFNLAGRLFVADVPQIREVPGGYVTFFAGGGYRGPAPNFNGPGVTAKFAALYAMITGPDDIMYVADGEMIRTVNQSAVVGTAAGVNYNTDPFEGTAANATFKSIMGLALDNAGNMFIADGGGHEIKRFGKREQYISVLAGNNKKPGYVDAIGPNAQFGKPMGMCIDAQGFIYVADADNNVIRKISTTGFKVIPDLPPGLVLDQRTGIISGTPTQPWPSTDYTIFGYNTEGMGTYTFNIQVNELIRKQQVIKFDPLPVMKDTDLDYPLNATAVGPSNSNPIRYESSDISIASVFDGKIHILKAGTVTITAYKDEDPFYFAATPVERTLVIQEVPEVFVYPDVVPKGNPVRIKLDPTGNTKINYDTVATVTGEYQLQQPSTTLQDSLYSCADVGLQTSVLKTGFGADPVDPLSARFNYPSNIVFDPVSGKMYISDKGNYRIRTIAVDGRVSTLAGNGGPGKVDGKAGIASFSKDLLSIITDAQGNIYVCDVANFLIRKITPDGTVSTFTTEALTGLNDFDPIEGAAIAIDKSGYIYIADKTRIYKAAPDGSSAIVFAGSGKQAFTDGIGTLADFDGIKGLYFGPDGTLFVTSSAANDVNSVRKITPAGVVTTLFRKTDPLLRFTRLVVDSKGNSFIASTEPKIYKVAADGTFTIYAGSASRIGRADGDGATIASFNNPQGIGIDPADNLYIADQDNHIIRKITPAGMVSTIAGSGTAGYFDNNGKSNKKTVNIPLVIINPITITSKYQPVTLPFLDACPAILEDYAAKATGTSPCTGSITFTQVPAAGRVLKDGEKVYVKLIASDGLSPYDTVSVTFSVTANKLPAPTVKITPDYYASCEGLEVKYTASAVNGGNAPTYQWFVNGAPVYSGGPEFTSSALLTGDKITCIVTNHDGCADISSLPSAPATLTADPPVTTSVMIFPSITGAFCPGSKVTFTAVPTNVQTTNGEPSYQWHINGNNTDTNSSTFSTKNLADGDVVTCTMVSGGKCVANPATESNAVTVSVLANAACDIIPPNTFTPNGDGINDYWQIPILSNYPNSTVSIYNRNGQLLFQSTGYSKPWDGTYSGKQVPAGTYYYMIDTHTNISVLSGWVAIIR